MPITAFLKKNNKTAMEKQYKIRAKLVFKGEFAVKAENRQQAEEKIRATVGCNLGNVQCLDEDVDWEFPTHGDIEINRKREEEQGYE